MSNEEIIKEELDSIFKDAEKLYLSSGKKVTGNWSKGKEILSSENYGELKSYAYLAGRGLTKKAGTGSTLYSRILEWIKNRGIQPIESSMKVTTLAFLITRKIHQSGTDSSRHLEVFDKVITPARIQMILDRVSSFNVSLFTDEIIFELKKISKNV